MKVDALRNVHRSTPLGRFDFRIIADLHVDLYENVIDRLTRGPR